MELLELTKFKQDICEEKNKMVKVRRLMQEKPNGSLRRRVEYESPLAQEARSQICHLEVNRP